MAHDSADTSTTFPEAAEEAVELCREGGSANVLFTCEHASERLPDTWRWPEADRWLAGTHWAFDLGARELARELCAELGTVAVLSRFSRLLADANRAIESPELFRAMADGKPVELNARIDTVDRAGRVALWEAYHEALDREVSASRADIVFSVHTFTPVYEGRARSLEVGVLFDRETELAERMRHALAADFRVEMNEPYSGKNGLMYSVERHARRHGRRAIEIEVRQDLAIDASARERVVRALARVLTRQRDLR